MVAKITPIKTKKVDRTLKWVNFSFKNNQDSNTINTTEVCDIMLATEGLAINA